MTNEEFQKPSHSKLESSIRKHNKKVSRSEVGNVAKDIGLGKRSTSDGYMPSRKLSVKSATPNEDKVAFHSSVEKKGGKAYRKETSHTVGGVAQSKNKLDLKVKQRTAQ
jgi:hypothetical protein